MNLDSLIDSIQNFEGVTRKKSIENVTNLLKDVYNVSGETLLAFGDDASAIDIGDNTVVLVAADGIWGKLMDADPYWAGYCSVLVNVNDIAAMGGKPIAMVNILSIDNEKIANEVLKGIVEGCKKFNVPMVGGHLHPDSNYNSLDVSIVGIAKKDHLITSFGATVGNKVLVAIDLDGKQHDKFALNWDTTFHKSPKLVQDQIKVMKTIAEKDLITAGKDISNPGILGTLEMLLESSSCGAIVELEKIPRNSDVSWEEWLKIYPGAGFVLTAKEENVDSVISLLKKYSIETAVVGEIIEDKKLFLTYDNQKKLLFDQEKNPVIGLSD
ncbi:methanogenesis marker 2 protein [Methanobrevibacter filiformis]|uniref:Phosphoribosylformylglycinamidine synthase 2 n=1 Tax=Methanobrevibacter filiformis TaxID=55758 RepID=A0A165Z088_9EURY|nr:methanogenesis marker 2 protein [Methanobrevibacter filiformis]KZX10086.1 phosphoribosylformylglycinamidine synthase 2 [Methanobrevibacter filiformis]